MKNDYAMKKLCRGEKWKGNSSPKLITMSSAPTLPEVLSNDENHLKVVDFKRESGNNLDYLPSCLLFPEKVSCIIIKSKSLLKETSTAQVFQFYLKV